MTGATAVICRKFNQVFDAEFKEEIKEMCKIAWPVMATSFLNFVILSESIIMCGHLGKLELDGAALANSIINGFGLSIGSGLITASDTLFSQCYGSAYKKRVGIYLQQSLLIISQVPLLLCALYINIFPVLLALGQDYEVSRLTADYLLYFCPGLMFYYLFLIQARYLQNQDKVIVPMVAALIANAFNVSSQYLGIYVWELGYICSPICQCLTYAIMAVLLFAYIRISGVYKETWDGWKVECLFNWWQFLKLAIPGMGMVSLEVVCWEIGTFIAGIIGTDELGAQSILFQTDTLAYMGLVGFGVAVNIRVGRHLGANDADRAKMAWKAGLCCMVVAASLLCIVFVAGKDIIPTLYTSDPGVLAIAAPIFPVLGVFLYLDGLACVCAGAMRGCGRQLTGVVFVFISYYLLGMSSGIPLALATDLHVIGLWIGLVIGMSIMGPAYVILLARQDWQTQARLAQFRVLAVSEKQLKYDTDCGEDTATAATESAAVPDAADETTGLLSSTSSRSGRPSNHRRYPSNPIHTPAAIPVAIRPPIVGATPGSRRRALLQRLASTACVMAIFAVGLAARLTVNSPDRWLPNGNSSQSNSTLWMVALQ